MFIKEVGKKTLFMITSNEIAGIVELENEKMRFLC